jgi:pimeloyl-ACP methyl ester carboxylesterase
MSEAAAKAVAGTTLGRQEIWVPTGGGHQLHVLEVRPKAAGREASGILFLHGLFSDGRFFLGLNDRGPARFFLDDGHVAYVADLRGHGRSRWPARRAWDWSFDAYAQEDIPALVRAVRERHQGPLFLLAHSMAGYAALAGLGVHPQVQGLLQGVCTLSAAVNDYSDGGLKKVLMVRFATLLSGVLGYFPAKALKWGPSDEPAALMRQFAEWASMGVFRSGDATVDYWQALGRVLLPVFCVVGEGDVFHASPRRAEKLVARLGSQDKRLVICGRSHGFSRNFGHVDILRSERARCEVLPRVLEWMRAGAPPLSGRLDLRSLEHA